MSVSVFVYVSTIELAISLHKFMSSQSLSLKESFLKIVFTILA